MLDELFDLSLYQSLRALASGELAAILDRLIPIEARHFTFWQDFFGVRIGRLDLGRRLKLQLIVLACRLFGRSAIHLVLEAIVSKSGARSATGRGEQPCGAFWRTSSNTRTPS